MGSVGVDWRSKSKSCIPWAVEFEIADSDFLTVENVSLGLQCQRIRITRHHAITAEAGRSGRTSRGCADRQIRARPIRSRS